MGPPFPHLLDVLVNAVFLVSFSTPVLRPLDEVNCFLIHKTFTFDHVVNLRSFSPCYRLTLCPCCGADEHVSRHSACVETLRVPYWNRKLSSLHFSIPTYEKHLLYSRIRSTPKTTSFVVVNPAIISVTRRPKAKPRSVRLLS